MRYTIKTNKIRRSQKRICVSGINWRIIYTLIEYIFIFLKKYRNLCIIKQHSNVR